MAASGDPHRDDAISRVGALTTTRIDGDVLDLMSSWVSHFRRRPARLTVLGMNSEELGGQPAGRGAVIHDLNADPVLPFDDARRSDPRVCCVSVDYLSNRSRCSVTSRCGPSGGLFVCTFSIVASDESHAGLVVRLGPTNSARSWRLLPPGRWVGEHDGRSAHARAPFR